ncbi:MAG TPA: hypothetical protein VE953_10055 [Terriglobales bacterium]|nr:hypothetical protein [Terriglobales bacterium]
MPNSVRETQRILDGGSDFSAPLAGVSAGRLEFRRGASRVTIRGEAMEELFRAHFDGPVPEVAVDGGTVAIRYRPLSPADWASFLWTPDDHRADIVLNSALPWDLEVRGGVSRLDANLSGLRLAGFEIRGGASNVELVLGEPRGIVPIRVRGGVSHVTIQRPAAVPVAASVRGGISKLALDDQRFGAVGGQTRVTTGAWRQATAGYDIEIAGGASHLTVEGR